MNQISSKITEAEASYAKAEQAMTKTLFRWSPDYLTAAIEYEAAANAFRSGNDLKRAIHSFKLAANLQIKNGSVFRAAQHMESAAKLSLQSASSTKEGTEAAKQFYNQAVGYYKDMGEFSKACDVLKKSAKVFEDFDEALSVKNYMEACDLMENQDKPHYAVETFRMALAFLVKKKKIKESLELLEREVAIFSQLNQPNNIHKCFLSCTVLQLVQGDVVAADRTFTSHLQNDEYLHSNECALAEGILIAFKNGNEEALQETLQKQGFNFLDNEIGRLAKKLSIYGNRSNPSASGSRSVASKGSKGTSAASAGTSGVDEINVDRSRLFKSSPSKTSAVKKDHVVETASRAFSDMTIKETKHGETTNVEENYDFAIGDFTYGDAGDDEVDLT